VGSRPDEVNAIFKFTLSFHPHKALKFIQPQIEMSTRNIKRKIVGSRAGPARKADNSPPSVNRLSR
jgi:hypothetical protein